MSKSPFRFIIYLGVGLLLYYLINSGQTSFSHQDARNYLAIGIIAVFVLLLIVQFIKRRYE